MRVKKRVFRSGAWNYGLTNCLVEGLCSRCKWSLDRRDGNLSFRPIYRRKP
jgi:hypothetical protein